MREIRGILPPVPTPFAPDGSFAPDAFTRLLRALEPEVDGFLVLGSNGEAAFLDESERRTVLETARAAIPPESPMLVGTGGESTRLVAARNREARDIGADAVLVLPPAYYKSEMTDAVLAAHFGAVADESPLPVWLYNIPQATTLSLSPALVATLARHPNIAGLKDSSGNVGALTEILRQVPEDFVVLSGNAPTLLPALSLGAKGGILAVANVAAAAYRQLLAHFQAGEMAAAQALQLRYNPLALAVTAGYGVPGLKAALALQGRDAGVPRAPLRPLGDEGVAQLRGLLTALEAPLAETR
jgi:4-hydroxy-2-oxoglutarate aldolase